MARVIVWNKRPAKFLSQSLKRISIDSVSQAERLEKGLLDSIEKFLPNPEKYPPDKFKRNTPAISGLLKNYPLELPIKLLLYKYEY